MFSIQVIGKIKKKYSKFMNSVPSKIRIDQRPLETGMRKIALSLDSLLPYYLTRIL